MKKALLVFLLVFAGCGTSTKPPASGSLIHYSTPALITVNPGNGTAHACYNEVVIEQVTFGTYNVYWTDERHQDHAVKGVHDIAVAFLPQGDATCDNYPGVQ
jgi:hypothetical protein